MAKIYAIRLGKTSDEKRKWAYVSETVYEEISSYMWASYWGGSTYYATRNLYTDGRRKQIKMHNQIVNPPNDLFVDHRDRWGLNNTDENLRLATHQQNCINRGLRSDSGSGYRGVSWNPLVRRWYAVISVNGKKITIGSYDSEVEAALAYDDAAQRYYGEWAFLNFDDTPEFDFSIVIYPKEYPLGLRGKDCERGEIPLQYDDWFALVDNDDWERTIQYKWYAHLVGEKWYVVGHINKQKVYLHRFLMGVTDGKLVVDHINGDTWDNRKKNLEVKDNTGNRHTQKHRKDNTTGFRGVFYDKRSGKYKYCFSHRFKKYQEWGFATAEEAAIEYDKAAIKYGDGRATLNFAELQGE